MEFTKSQIAGLVLGYLKSEKCLEACNSFLESSEYFQNSRQSIKTGKYLITRVSGMSLVDFLKEYAAIYSIVQARLEASDYYNEDRPKTSLTEQLLYLFDHTFHNSSPILSVGSEVEATQPHDLPGNTDSGRQKTPKLKTPRLRCSGDKNELLDVSEVMTQTLLENHEFHERIAEAINTVINTPDRAKPVEEVGAGASRELDAIIKSVVQKTEEDPIYNKLIDEIIGSTLESEASKSNNGTSSCSTNSPEKLNDHSKTKRISQSPSTIEDHNNDAVRSIIAAAQNLEPPLVATSSADPGTTVNKAGCNNEIYVFDGTLDNYLKNTGAANAVQSNSLYINTGGVIVVPQEPPQKQFYFVNNQPLLVPQIKNVITDRDILAMPTVFVSDEVQAVHKNQSKSTPKKPIKIAAKPTVPKSAEINVQPQVEKRQLRKKKSVAAISMPTISPAKSRLARNLNFATPGKLEVKKQTRDTWDEDLRKIAGADRAPASTSTPKRKKLTSKNKKTCKIKTEEEAKDVEKATEIVNKTPPHKVEVTEAEETASTTPFKENAIPKTPGFGSLIKTLTCTPFTENLEEQLLKGVDLMSLPTPKIPITPGFSLTNVDMYTHRSTDYSTSSSYYQPSDNEHNKSIEQLLEECRQIEKKSPNDFTDLKILSEVVTEQCKIETTNCNNTLSTFNQNVIGKKNLNLIQKHSSSSSSSDSDSEVLEEQNKTVVEKKPQETISDIINSVPVKDTLRNRDNKSFFDYLKEKKKQTAKSLKKVVPAKKTKNKIVRKKIESKNIVEDGNNTTDEEAQNLVKGLWQRGIHLVHNKTPAKKQPEVQQIDPADEVFDNETLEGAIEVTHGTENTKKSLSDYNLNVLEKVWQATVYDEHLKEEVTRKLTFSPYEVLMDLPSKILTPRKKSEGLSEADSELMDFVFIAGAKDAKGGKKRKLRLSGEDRQAEKRSKYENNIKLLKKIDVETFLDKVHGE